MNKIFTAAIAAAFALTSTAAIAGSPEVAPADPIIDDVLLPPPGSSFGSAGTGAIAAAAVAGVAGLALIAALSDDDDDDDDDDDSSTTTPEGD